MLERVGQGCLDNILDAYTCLDACTCTEDPLLDSYSIHMVETELTTLAVLSKNKTKTLAKHFSIPVCNSGFTLV